MNLLLALGLVLGVSNPAVERDVVGQNVDISQSAYQYRADRKVDANPPESWLALIHFANLPLNKPVDLNNDAIKQTLCGLLWEEIRPVQTLELTWPATAKHQPGTDALRISALINQGSSSSWWNNLATVPESVRPILSNDGKTYSYMINQATCGLIVSLAGAESASKYDVPVVRVLVPDTWKKMDIEVEWGFDATTCGKDYSGRVEAYDGRISDLQPLAEDAATTVRGPTTWNSAHTSGDRRGVKLSLLYMGRSKWRRFFPYTTQPEDVARSIVTLWTKSGSFSFLAADLENGPILAPEYGFFVRRCDSPPPVNSDELPLRVAPLLMGTKMNAIAGDERLKGWGSDDTPWFGSNPTDQSLNASGIDFPAKSAAMHPGQFVDVVAEWKSPIKGTVTVLGGLRHAQAGGKGIDWWVVRDKSTRRYLLETGRTDGTGGFSTLAHSFTGSFPVERGDRVSLVVGPKGDHRCCTVNLNWVIRELGGSNRTWNLTNDVAANPLEGNPHSDSYGNPDVWQFCSEMPMFPSAGTPSEPPIPVASRAKSARAFLAELKIRGLETIRERTRKHVEQTWLGAVTSTRGNNLPPIPVPPADSMPPMQVQVPSDRLTAQWNLGAWHLVRHCATNPKTGKRWFNDYPYGILAAETYLVLSVLDQLGSHEAAADGFDQWLSLPLDRNPAGTDPARALPEHPVGLFADGHGALTNADGPSGYGGNMDIIHAFGPGSIGWALTQHYWMTGDKAWLKANAPRILANAEWMLRQRRVVAGMVPGGDRLWCKGLQPALQVTPDSGGLWMQFYECEAYYWASVSRLAVTLSEVDPARGAKLKADAEAYRNELRAAVERSIALSPVEQVRDGTYHSVIPFACYVRGLATGSWGWQRDGSGSHVGPLYWDTVQTAAALVSPAGLLSANDVRVQGYLDVLEDRLLLENQNVGTRDWFGAGWQYQGGLERQANMNLASDDIPVFLRSFLNCYAVDILPTAEYVFNEHAVHGPPDKIFEEAAFLERFRNLLVMEDGPDLWLSRGCPRAWLEQGLRISVQHAPTAFGDVSYEVVSDSAHGRIEATITMPDRNPPREVWLRLRHPSGLPIKSVLVNRKPWKYFDRAKEIVILHGQHGQVEVEVSY